MSDVVTLSREDLYEQVWTTPLVRLASQYGLSDVALAKTCRRMHIPLPGLGYWARKAAGQGLRRTALGKLPSGSSQRDGSVSFDLTRLARKRVITDGPLSEFAAFEAAPENAIVVNPSARLTGPFLRDIAKALKASSVNDYHLHTTSRSGLLNVAVSRATISRAMNIVAALVAAFKKRGWPLSQPKHADGYSGVVVLGQTIQFHLREHTVIVPLEDQRQVDPWRGGVYTPQPSPRYRPSGDLKLSIDSWAQGQRRSWKDSPSQRLEDCLHDFMLGLVACAHDEIERTREREERDRQWLAAELVREEIEKRRAEEVARVKMFEVNAAAWAKSQQLFSFLSAVRTMATDEGNNEERDRWMQWAATYATTLDPLKGPPSRIWRAAPTSS